LCNSDEIRYPDFDRILTLDIRILEKFDINIPSHHHHHHHLQVTTITINIIFVRTQTQDELQAVYLKN